MNTPVVAVRIVEWTPEFAVGVREIDREHQNWFEILNRLHAAMLEGRGTQVLTSLFAEMTQYTLSHFAREEEFMKGVRYPEALEHTRQHEGLRRRTHAFVERFERGEVTMTIELSLFLAEWIRKHIITSDRLLGEYVQALPATGPTHRAYR